MVLVHHHGGPLLDVLAAHSSCLERNPFGDLRDLNHLDFVAVSQDLEGAELQLEYQTGRVVLLKNDKIPRTVLLCDRFCRSMACPRVALRQELRQ